MSLVLAGSALETEDDLLGSLGLCDGYFYQLVFGTKATFKQTFVENRLGLTTVTYVWSAS